MKLVGILLTLVFLGAPSGPPAPPQPAVAAAPQWQSGSAFWGPPLPLSSPQALQSLDDFSRTGANHVMPVISWYVANGYDSIIAPGSSTPKDDELVAFVGHAHALGLKVVLAIRVESKDGSWRAYFAPTDRGAWFANYAVMLDHYARLAQANGIEGLVIGQEFVSLTGPAYTQQWANLIHLARSDFKGFLTYSSNWGSGFYDSSGRDSLEEFSQIEFWPLLDYVGISAYLELTQDQHPTLGTFIGSWARWYNGRVEPVLQRYQKPLLITEVGYRSANIAAAHPWDYSGGVGLNLALQAQLYQALFQFWGDVPEARGVYLWYWDANPSAGGPQDSGYSPQGKTAEAILSFYFSLLSSR